MFLDVNQVCVCGGEQNAFAMHIYYGYWWLKSVSITGVIFCSLSAQKLYL